MIHNKTGTDTQVAYLLMFACFEKEIANKNPTNVVNESSVRESVRPAGISSIFFMQRKLGLS
jgi:hypothetical protein